MYYYVGMVTGALLLIGTLLILGFGKGQLDPVTNTIKMKLPILGTVSTRNPLVFIACIGFALLIVCSRMGQSAQPKDQSIAIDGTIQIDGTIHSPETVTVYFVAFPKGQYTQRGSGPIHTLIPMIDNVDYRAEFVVGDTWMGDQPVNVVKGRAHLDYDVDKGSVPSASPNVIPRIEASDAVSRDFLKQ